jgi:hypothetical protein
LLEVLIASIVVGITVLGVSLMLVRASAFTVSEGTNQGELYLAEQKLEKLRAPGIQREAFLKAPVLGSGDAGANAECSSGGEPCYSETPKGGAVTNGQPQSFTRLTCVDYVSDSGPPYPEVCTPNPGSPTLTKRVQVKVQPLNQAALAKAGDITLDMILINTPAFALTP